MSNTAQSLPFRSVRHGTTLKWSFTLLMALVTITACDRSNQSATDARSNSAAADVIGKLIEFRAGGDSEQYRGTGWSKTEANFTWSEGTAAKLTLPVSAANEALTLTVNTAALIQQPQLPSQPVEVYANGKKIADWEVGTTADFTATIPAEAAKTGKLQLEFRTPKATSPKALGQSEDARILGICVHSLQVTPSA